jgi:hypothetical protein
MAPWDRAVEAALEADVNGTARGPHRERRPPGATEGREPAGAALDGIVGFRPVGSPVESPV